MPLAHAHFQPLFEANSPPGAFAIPMYSNFQELIRDAYDASFTA